MNPVPFCRIFGQSNGSFYNHFIISRIFVSLLDFWKRLRRRLSRQVYWDNKSYYGFGLGATSYLFGKRFSRPRSAGGYAKWVGDFSKTSSTKSGRDVFGSMTEPWGPGHLPEDFLQDTIILGLRRQEGLDMQKMARMFGKDLAASILHACSQLREAGLVRFVFTSGCQGIHEHEILPAVREQLGPDVHVQWPLLQLTDPDGFLRENLVLTTILAAIDPN